MRTGFLHYLRIGADYEASIAFPPGPRVICKNSHGALVYLGIIRILPIPPPVNSALSSPSPSYVFCMPLRADRDLTPTHHVVLLSLPLSDLWFRPCTGNIPHPLHGKHDRAELPSHYSPLHGCSNGQLTSAGRLGLPGEKTTTRGNSAFWELRAHPGHRARPQRPTRGKLLLQVLPTNWLLVYCISQVPTVRDYFHLQIHGLSPRRHHIFSLHFWPVQRWCWLAGTIITGTGHCIAGPSSRCDQAGNIRDIPVARISWAKQWKTVNARDVDKLAINMMIVMTARVVHQPRTSARYKTREQQRRGVGKFWESLA